MVTPVCLGSMHLHPAHQWRQLRPLHQRSLSAGTRIACASPRDRTPGRLGNSVICLVSAPSAHPHPVRVGPARHGRPAA